MKKNNQNLKSDSKNSIFHFLFSKFWLLILFSVFYFLFPAFSASAAVLYLTPEKGEFHQEDIFMLEIKLDTEGEYINTAEVYLDFPTEILSFEDISKGNSILILWPKEPVNYKNIVYFAGGVPGGYQGKDGILAKLAFRVRPTPLIKESAEIEIKLTNASRVLLNDGLGTQANLMRKNAILKILPGKSETPQDQWLEQLKQDKSPPQDFSIELNQDPKLFNNKYFIIFSTTDKESGIDHYEIKEGKRNWETATSPHVLKNQRLTDDIWVKAIDKAGNVWIEILEAPKKPVLKYIAYGILAIFALCVIIILIMRKRLLIFLILGLVFLFVPATKALAASLFVTPQTGNYTVGENFTVTVKVNTADTPINAAQGTLNFSSEKLSVVGVSKAGSIFSLWTAEPSYSNEAGIISFGGGLPNPGYNGPGGKVIAITFKPKANGVTTLNWSSGAVLANDGRGTNILGTMSGGSYTLGTAIVVPPPEITLPVGVPAKPEVVSSTHPEESKWYKESTVKLSWNLPKDVTDVSIIFNQKSTSNPGSISDGLFDSKIYGNVADGIWYLHLKFKNKIGWGDIRHFRVQIDSVPPSPFTIDAKEGKETQEAQPTLLFEAKDETSGIDRYKIRIDAGYTLAETEQAGFTAEIPSAPYKMPVQPPGRHTVVIEAFDKAENNTAAVLDLDILPIESPKITDYPQRMSIDENLVIKGTALPKTTIKVYIKKEGIGAAIGETQTDENGNWFYAHDGYLNRGVYKISAIAINEKGAQSFPSREVHVLVSLPPLFKIGGVIIDYITVIIVLIALIGMIILGSYWMWHRFVMLKRRLIKETRDVNRVMRNAFDLLKQEVEDQMAKLDKVKNKRELSEEEKEIETQLKKDIDIAERYIRREVEDVEKRLKIKVFDIRKLFKRKNK